MKIGIFTFHDEYNYGSVLQTYALQSYLMSKGHEVLIIHHHLSPRDERIKGIFATRSPRAWIRFIVLGVLGGGQFSRQLRLRKSRIFIEKNLHLTKYRFYLWNEAPRELGVDALVVGSDQLWSCQWEVPTKYLLEGAPEIPAVAYAVSIGVSSIPIALHDTYRKGFQRFQSISVREKKAIELIRECRYGGNVVQTIDPTLLVDKSVWDKFIPRQMISKKGYVFCYLMGVNILTALPVLARFAKRNNCAIKLLVDDFFWNSAALRPSCLVKSLICGIRLRMFCYKNDIQVCLKASHEDFIKSISAANMVLTDSFHALMFSIVFGKNIRMIKPANSYRAKMFSRIEEACNQFMKTNLLYNTIDDALVSFEREGHTIVNWDMVNASIESSRKWLMSAIDGLKTIKS